MNMDVIVSLCKRRGFIFQSSEIYGGTGSCWDYGPLGVELKNNVKQAWWRDNVHLRSDMVGLDASILMPRRLKQFALLALLPGIMIGIVKGRTDPDPLPEGICLFYCSDTQRLRLSFMTNLFIFALKFLLATWTHPRSFFAITSRLRFAVVPHARGVQTSSSVRLQPISSKADDVGGALRAAEQRGIARQTVVVAHLLQVRPERLDVSALPGDPSGHLVQVAEQHRIVGPREVARDLVQGAPGFGVLL